MSMILRQLRRSEGTSLIEVSVVVLILGIIGSIFTPTFASWIDNSYDSRSQIAVTETSKIAQIIFVENGDEYPEQEELVAAVQEQVDGYNITSYDPEGVITDPKSVSILREDYDQISVCNHSETGHIYCLRANHSGVLVVPEEDEEVASTQTDNGIQALFGPDQAAALSDSNVIRSDAYYSYCVGLEETATRGCLATADRSETSNDDAVPGWEPEAGPLNGPYDRGVLGRENVVGIDSLTVYNDSKIKNGAGSNGQVTIQTSSEICGGLRIGLTATSPVGNIPGQPWSNGQGGGLCQAYPNVTRGELFPPDVVMPPDIATNNSNARLAGDDPVGAGVWQRGNISWNATTRVLQINYNQLTLMGDKPYFLCRLVVTGGATLFFDAPGTGTVPTKIFFDRPENCSGQTQPLVVHNGTSVRSIDIQNNPSMPPPGFFIPGSINTATSVSLNGGSSIYRDVVIYAPRSNVSMLNGFYFNGGIVGKTVAMDGGSNAQATFDGDLYPLPIIPNG